MEKHKKVKMINIDYVLQSPNTKYKKLNFLPVAPLCRSSPAPSMLGISFKRPSTIICEVRLR